ncbi:unnamed protein product [Hymenolepis diminuta]|uniref:XRN1_D1 domain-containing protein n=1 Tax=Hymenolepis diminuta TaxID=6216 RepID=A0A0R3STU1_HYMDI|nr:unnamed protein product [Hymenolepis diminuta]
MLSFNFYHRLYLNLKVTVGFDEDGLIQLYVDVKQVFGEKEGAVWKQNPNKESISRVLEYQPQIKGEKNGMVCMDARIIDTASACEIRRQQQTDYQQKAEIPQIDGTASPVDAC